MAGVPPDLTETEGAFRQRLSPEEIGLLAERLAKATDPVEAALLRQRLTRGFYATPAPRRRRLPPRQSTKRNRVP